ARYSLEGVLGEGSYGKVYSVKDKLSPAVLAVKVQAVKAGREKPVLAEWNVWESLGSHPNIVQPVALCQEVNVYFMVMEVCAASLPAAYAMSYMFVLFDRMNTSPQWTAAALMGDFRQSLLALSFSLELQVPLAPWSSP
ncbi:unnamed protein product, partial [Polarella glacialis]